MKKTIFPLWAGMLALTLLTSCAGYRAPTVVDNAPAPAGYYRVQPSDNLYRIGLKFRQSTATLAQRNQLSDVNQLEVGQLLCVAPECGRASASAQRTAPTKPAAKTTSPPQRAVSSPPLASGALRNLNLAWPASGRVLSGYDGNGNKGINISGVHGSAVQAAASGEVVYASDQLRGYGRMILLRHSKQVLTAYAHSSRILVKVGQKVNKGETIAYMGSADNGQTMLHFELRVSGRAVNPIPYLPAR